MLLFGCSDPNHYDWVLAVLPSDGKLDGGYGGIVWGKMLNANKVSMNKTIIISFIFDHIATIFMPLKYLETQKFKFKRFKRNLINLEKPPFWLKENCTAIVMLQNTRLEVGVFLLHHWYIRLKIKNASNLQWRASEVKIDP